MSEVAAPEAPQSSPAPAPEADFDAAISQHNTQGTTPARTQPEAPKPKAAPAAKPDAKPQDKPATRDRSFQPLRKEGDEPEQPVKATPEKPDAEADVTKDMKPEAVSRWRELRAIEDEHKTVKPEYEKLKARVAELEGKPNVPEEMQKEYESLKKWHAAKEVEQTPAYKKAVSEPWNSATTGIQQLADYSKVPFDRILEVMKDPNDLSRNDAIADLFKDGEKPLSDGALKRAYDLGDKLHDIWKEDARLRNEAGEALNVLEGQRQQETTRQKQEREAKYTVARDEAFKLFEGSLGELLKDQDLAKAMKERTPSEEPMEQAMAFLSHEVLPDVIKAWNKDRTELFEARKKLAARRGAQPSIETPPSVNADEKPVADIDSAISQHNSGGWRR